MALPPTIYFRVSQIIDFSLSSHLAINIWLWSPPSQWLRGEVPSCTDNGVTEVWCHSPSSSPSHFLHCLEPETFSTSGEWFNHWAIGPLYKSVFLYIFLFEHVLQNPMCILIVIIMKRCQSFKHEISICGGRSRPAVTIPFKWHCSLEQFLSPFIVRRTSCYYIKLFS